MTLQQLFDNTTSYELALWMALAREEAERDTAARLKATAEAAHAARKNR